MYIQTCCLYHTTNNLGLFLPKLVLSFKILGLYYSNDNVSLELLYVGWDFDDQYDNSIAIPHYNFS
jgi:hypothetical protein